MTFGQTVSLAPSAHNGGSIITPKPKILRVGIYNIMPNRRTTGDDITNVFGQFHPNIEFVHIAPKGQDHKSAEEKYRLAGDAYEREISALSWSAAKERNLNRMIITGADLAKYNLEQVDFCGELKDVFNFTGQHKIPKFMTCWASDAYGEYAHDIHKKWQHRKSIDVMPHELEQHDHYAVRNLKELFAPIARNTEVLARDIDTAKGIFNIATMKTHAGERVAGLIGYENSNDLSTRFHLEYGSDENLWKERRRDEIRHSRNPRMYPTYPLPAENIDPDNFGMTWGEERKSILGGWLNQETTTDQAQLSHETISGTGTHLCYS